MTITVTISRWSYTGDGNTTIFPYTNKIFNKTDLQVNVAGVLQTVDTDYTVDGVSSSTGGNVTFATAPANNAEIVIVRIVPDTQETSLPLGGSFPSERVEEALDKNVILVQQVRDGEDRTLRLQDLDPALSMGRLPLKTELANKPLGFDANGDPQVIAGLIEYAVTDYIKTLLDDVDAPAARVTLGVVIGTDVQAYDADNAFTDVAQEYTAQQNIDAVNKNAAGSDLVTNGDFATDTAWTKGTGWTISAGVADVSGAQGGDTDLEQGITVTDGDSYEVTFTVLNYTAGTITPRVGGTAGTARSANGTYTEVIVAGSGSAPELEFRADATGDMQIDNVVVKRVSVDWDLNTEQALNLTLDASGVVLKTPTNLKDGSTGNVKVIQDATGSRTITWPSIAKWSVDAGGEPALSTAANAVDLFSWYCDGTNLLMSGLGDFQ